jgi:hypothetical protein
MSDPPWKVLRTSEKPFNTKKIQYNQASKTFEKDAIAKYVHQSVMEL